MLGWIVAKISRKLKHKSLITVLISLVVIGAYYFVYFKAQGMIQDLLANATVYGARIKGAAYPVYLFGSVGIGDVRASAIVSAAVAVLFSLMRVLLSRSFLRIATATGKVARREYRETHSRHRSVNTALLCREFSRFTANPNYMLNCGMGILMLPVAGGMLLWKSGELTAVLRAVPQIYDALPVLLAAVVCMMAAMNDMAAPSVSLEGKCLWQMQSLPVTPWQVLRAKLTMQLLLTAVPVAVCLVCAALAVPMTAAELAMLTAVSLLFTAFSALLGLFLGLRMPNLTWTREIIPIKQSASVAIALFGGWGYAAVLGGGYLLAGWRLGAVWYLGCFAAATLLACLALYLWLKKRGGAVLAAVWAAFIVWTFAPPELPLFVDPETGLRGIR